MNDSNSYAARIVVGGTGAAPLPTRGTKVMVGDVQLDGVTGITLRADVDDVWRATIECIVEPPADLIAAAQFEVRTPETWLSRLLRWIAGPSRGAARMGIRVST